MSSVSHARSRWFLAWFSRHVDRRLKRSFGRIRVSGLDNLRALAGPVVVVSNHSAWWDPLVAIWLTNRIVPFESFAIMDAANLARLPFFAKAGAIGVDRTSPSDGARVVRHCARLLREPKRLLWVFPQGEERPLYERPLTFHGGADAIARLAKAPVVHIAIAYGFHENEMPDLDIVVDTPRQTVDAARVEELLAEVPAHVTLHAVRTTSLAARLLAWLTHPSTK